MPGLEKSRIEALFVENPEKEQETGLTFSLPMYNSNEVMDKVKRKRVLISSDFKTAFRVNRIFDVFFELNQSRWCTEKTKSKKFTAFIKDNITDLSQRYNVGPIYLAPP